MHVHKNDTVLVISGNSLGKQGKVLKVFPDKSRVIIESVNIVKRHARPTQKNPHGGIVQKEGPISAANVMVVCPKCNEATRVSHTHVIDPSNRKRKTMRVCKKCNEMF
jgi:large subunit ribosomal protein L24